MSHPAGTVMAEHDGKSYRLCLNWGVLADLEDEFPEDFDAMINGRKNPKMKFILRMTAMSLSEENPDMTADEAGALARKMTSQSLFQRLISAAFPDAEVSSGNPERPKRTA